LYIAVIYYNVIDFLNAKAGYVGSNRMKKKIPQSEQFKKERNEHTQEYID
jgi:hypothetical protein